MYVKAKDRYSHKEYIYVFVLFCLFFAGGGGGGDCFCFNLWIIARFHRRLSSFVGLLLFLFCFDMFVLQLQTLDQVYTVCHILLRYRLEDN